jgi:hypothetical protein
MQKRKLDLSPEEFREIYNKFEGNKKQVCEYLGITKEYLLRYINAFKELEDCVGTGNNRRSTKGQTQVNLTVEDIINALYEHQGNIARTAAALGVTRDAIEFRVRNDASIRSAVLKARKEGTNYVADKLWEHIEDGNLDAQKFFLNTVGGWSTNQNMNVSGSLDLDVSYDLSMLSVEELEKLNELIGKVTVKPIE